MQRAHSQIHDDPPSAENARERLVRTAYDLFLNEGFTTVDVDRIVAEAGVSKSTLYRHFHSKDALALAVLERREEIWTKGWLDHELEQRADTPEGKLLAIFDAFDAWFRRGDYKGCMFTRSLVESGGAGTIIGGASARALADVTVMVRGLTEDLGVRDPDALARAWKLLMQGAIIISLEGDRTAALRAKEVAKLLLAAVRPPTVTH